MNEKKDLEYVWLSGGAVRVPVKAADADLPLQLRLCDTLLGLIAFLRQATEAIPRTRHIRRHQDAYSARSGLLRKILWELIMPPDPVLPKDRDTQSNDRQVKELWQRIESRNTGAPLRVVQRLQRLLEEGERQFKRETLSRETIRALVRSLNTFERQVRKTRASLIEHHI